MKRQIWKRVTAFLLMAVIITQSGMTAFATEDIPGSDKAEEYGSGQEQEITEAEEIREPGENMTQEETPEAAEEPEETTEETPEAVTDRKETPEGEETPEEILPEETPDPEMPEEEGTEIPLETEEITPAPEEESKETEIIWMESRLQEEAPVENLTKEQIYQLDERLAEFAEGISPVIETEENRITFMGELEYAEGYYLAFRINPDKECFTQSGTIQITYEEEDSETVRYDAPEDVWEKGFWDVIMPLPENALKMVVSVDNDGEDENPAKSEKDMAEGDMNGEEPEEESEAVYERYAPGIYEIDLSGLQKTAVEADTFEADTLEAALPEEQAVITNMTAPVIKTVTTRDTTAVVKFVPNDIIRSIELPDEENGNGYYTIKLTDKVTGDMLEAVDVTWQEQKAEYSYKFSIIPGEGTEKDPLYTCEIMGLSSNKAYTVVIIANYGAGENKLEKPSKATSFTTKKEMLTGAGGSLTVSYIRLDDLRKNPNDQGTQVDYSDEGKNSFACNQTYALMAEVSNLSRALETEKLTWTILTEQEKAANKKDATLKAGASTFEAQLEIKTPGTYIITAVSTVTKEKLFRFFVEVPEEDGGNTAEISLQSELFYFYGNDERISLDFEKVEGEAS